MLASPYPTTGQMVLTPAHGHAARLWRHLSRPTSRSPRSCGGDGEGGLDERRSVLALTDLAALPVQRAPHAALLSRCGQLRGNLTLYEAAYVALAEVLQRRVLTGDKRIARSPGPTCHIEVVRPDEPAARPVRDALSQCRESALSKAASCRTFSACLPRALRSRRISLGNEKSNDSSAAMTASTSP